MPPHLETCHRCGQPITRLDPDRDAQGRPQHWRCGAEPWRLGIWQPAVLPERRDLLSALIAEATLLDSRSA